MGETGLLTLDLLEREGALKSGGFVGIGGNWCQIIFRIRKGGDHFAFP